MSYSVTPLIRINWDGDSSGCVENPDNWIFLAIAIWSSAVTMCSVHSVCSVYSVHIVYSVYNVHSVYSVHIVYSVYSVHSVYSVYSVHIVYSVYSVHSVYSVYMHLNFFKFMRPCIVTNFFLIKTY